MIIMKKIIIVTHCMEVGGAEKSLIELLNCIDYETYAVDLFLLKHSGEFMSQINEHVNLLNEIPSYAALMKPISTVLKSKQFLIGISRLFAKNLSYRNARKSNVWKDTYTLEYAHKYSQIFLPQISNERYDLAISFLTPHYITTNKVKADKKVAWIHTDYSKMVVDIKSELNMWRKYDYIAAISESSKKAFVKIFSELEKKVFVMENILLSESIRKQAEGDVSEEIDKSKITICSVGRFSYPKNFDNVPNICKRIVESGYDIRWYLIGSGGEERKIRERIKEEHMEEYVFILGKKINPYPYMKACDFYIQPSRYEGKSVSVREAQILQKPVVITNYTTAKSQVEDGVDGAIVPIDNEECAKGIVNVIKDQALQRNLIENCKKRDFGNEKEIEKLYNLMG